MSRQRVLGVPAKKTEKGRAAGTPFYCIGLVQCRVHSAKILPSESAVGSSELPSLNLPRLRPDADDARKPCVSSFIVSICETVYFFLFMSLFILLLYICCRSEVREWAIVLSVSSSAATFCKAYLTVFLRISFEPFVKLIPNKFNYTDRKCTKN